jgi:hypothetical protein
LKMDLTEIIFLLDRSGSMGGLESDTIGGEPTEKLMFFLR